MTNSINIKISPDIAFPRTNNITFYFHYCLVIHIIIIIKKFILPRTTSSFILHYPLIYIIIHRHRLSVFSPKSIARNVTRIQPRLKRSFVPFLVRSPRPGEADVQRIHNSARLVQRYVLGEERAVDHGERIQRCVYTCVAV